MTTSPPVHQAVQPLANLLGAWQGRGHGEYPTIEPFSYVEEITFGHVGKPFLAYQQRTRHAESGQPLHAETGYWRPVDDGGVELVLAHPTGILECLTGNTTIDDEGRTVIEFTCRPVLSPTAKSVTETSRVFTIEGDTLRYDMAMAAVGHDLTHHLSARLDRVTARRSESAASTDA